MSPLKRGAGRRSDTLDETKYLLPDDAARLRRHLEDEFTVATARGGGLRLRNACFASLLLDTGLRVSEASALVLRDLVLDGPRRLVRVRHGKGGKARDVTLGGDLRVLLKRFVEVRKAGGGVGPEAPLFPAGRGTRCMSRITGWRIWKRFLRCLGLDAEGRGCHAARHTRAVLLYATTRDLRLVGRELGHSDVRTTTIYADVLGEDRAAAAEAVDERLRAVPAGADAAKPKVKQIRGPMKPKSALEAAR